MRVGAQTRYCVAADACEENVAVRRLITMIMKKTRVVGLA
jgi:hypothetical protein